MCNVCVVSVDCWLLCFDFLCFAFVILFVRLRVLLSVHVVYVVCIMYCVDCTCAMIIIYVVCVVWRPCWICRLRVRFSDLL